MENMEQSKSIKGMYKLLKDLYPDQKEYRRILKRLGKRAIEKRESEQEISEETLREFNKRIQKTIEAQREIFMKQQEMKQKETE